MEQVRFSSAYIMRDDRSRRRLVLGLALAVSALLAALGPFAAASANGGTVKVFGGRSGAYDITVGILPERPLVGAIHFSITPLDAATSLPVSDAKITLLARDREGRPAYQARALNNPVSPQYYDANITFESPGVWNLEVEVRSEALGGATVIFPLEVYEQSITSQSGGSVVFLGVVIALIVGALYIWMSARRRRRVSGS